MTPSLDCPHCGERVPDHFRFCGICGGLLTDAAVEGVGPRGSNLEGASPQRLVNEGYQLSRQQRWQEAVTLYERAVAEDPLFQQAYWTLGFALNHLGRYEEAISVLEKGFALPGDQPEHRGQFLYSLAFANANMKNYDEALRQVREALAPKQARYGRLERGAAPAG